MPRSRLPPGKSKAIGPPPELAPGYRVDSGASPGDPAASLKGERLGLFLDPFPARRVPVVSGL